MEKLTQTGSGKIQEYNAFISGCTVILPKDLKSLSIQKPEDMLEVALHLSKTICSDPHMLPVKPDEIIAATSVGLATLMVDSQFAATGFARLNPWKNAEGETKGLELGSVWIHPDLRNHHLAQLLIEQLIGDTYSQEKNVPIFAVVTEDNVPSKKLFQRLENWQEQLLTAQETENYSKFFINGINIFEGWNLPSVIYWYNQNI
ncbi:GNAT family N-acetyltransferase [Candidatus Roizmanbacteria bacterium]|nr:GNAT family N-acetyltransferase [Candidatus Roizmanbacteria bacterium]